MNIISTLRRALVLTACVTVGLTLTLAGIQVQAASNYGPALGTPASVVARALSCTPGVSTSSKPTVLLVHGTVAAPSEDWGQNLAIELPKRGYPTCMVTLPDRALGDMQRTVEYVVASIRTLYVRSGKKVAVIGHSQGAFLITYALRFWPDLATKVSDAIGYSGTYTYGTSFASTLCTAACTPAFQQFRPGSKFLRAVSAHPLPKGPAYTAYATALDEIVTPQPIAGKLVAPDARSYRLQDICPLDPAEHLLTPFEKPFLALTLDALTHPGPADLARLGHAPCGLLPQTPLTLPGLVTFALFGVLTATQNLATSEPPLRPYLASASS